MASALVWVNGQMGQESVAVAAAVAAAAIAMAFEDTGDAGEERVVLPACALAADPPPARLPELCRNGRLNADRSRLN